MKTTTNYLTIAFMAFFILFTGCSKDDDLLNENDSEKTAESLLGKWHLVKIVEQETPGSTETHPAENGEYIEFKSGGKGRMLEEEDDEWDFTWKVQGKKIIIDNEDEVIIVKLTKQELEFKDEGTYQDQDGKTIKYVTTWYLKK